MLKNALVLSLFVVATLCKPLHKRWDDFKVKHAWVDGVPKGWEVIGPAPPEYRLAVRIGLRQDRIDDLIAHLYAVSDPNHHRYGQHLTKGEVEILSTPHPDSTSLVEDWLSHYGLLNSPECQLTRSSSGDWISLSIPAGQLEQMLGTKYHVYKHTATETTLIRTTSYNLPSILHEHVTVVTPSTYFGRPKPQDKTSFIQSVGKTLSETATDLGINDAHDAHKHTVSPTCNSKITPSCLNALYNISYTPVSTKKNSLGVAGYLNEFANHADLKLFFAGFRPDAVYGDFNIVQIANGGNNQSDPGVEANLDIQYTLGLTYPTPNTYYSIGGSPPYIPDGNTPTNTNEPYLSFLDFILDQGNIPQTITTSYGDDEQTVPRDYAEAVCNGFAKLGARGSSVLFSSGDSGVGGGDCLTNDGKNRTEFLPIFPASCPYVTTVGGTNGTAPERAALFSGGGFSNYFGRPSYQSQAVETFLGTLGDQTYTGLFNASGRGFPDVAAQGLNFQVVVGGKIYSVGGTSASSPTFAAVVSLLNDARITAGLPSLGFLNPWLYTEGFKGLNDIVSGNNPGCGTDGFKAVKGWDPVTGLGTPNFGLLKHLVVNRTTVGGRTKKWSVDKGLRRPWFS
ncbi:subtilisin-like protein [Thelephora ganbajun]|uniref:Subtilisin-like protein n=1 Tax=Thelephora ganbajun TaxID=370292 RepID=A0ACB6Z802_THEGA|nr:subtilisin-like protein [Thelephora ganbajun]